MVAGRKVDCAEHGRYRVLGRPWHLAIRHGNEEFVGTAGQQELLLAAMVADGPIEPRRHPYATSAASESPCWVGRPTNRATRHRMPSGRGPVVFPLSAVDSRTSWENLAFSSLL